MRQTLSDEINGEVTDSVELSRRAFLKLGGTAAFTGLLLGGKAIKAKAGPIQVVRRKVGKNFYTVCCYCSAGCGLIATVADGKLINTEGDPSNPFNRGAGCPKGNSLQQLMYNENRVLEPMRLKPGSEKGPNAEFEPITWHEALDIIGQKTKDAVADAKTAGFSSFSASKSGRPQGDYYYDGQAHPVGWIGTAVGTNEEGWLRKKLLHMMGSANIDHQARKCHASTVAALGASFGLGAQTNHWLDFQHAKTILICGSNQAENHSATFRYVNWARDNGATLISADPRFTRSSARADLFTHFRPGTDVAIYMGLIKYAIDHNYVDEDYLITRTNAPLILKYNPANSRWEFDLVDGHLQYADSSGTVRVVEEQTNMVAELRAGHVSLTPSNLQGERKTVYQVLVDIASGYTSDDVYNITGIEPEVYEQIAEEYCAPGGDPSQPSTTMYAMGMTQHSNATQGIRTLAVMQLVLGNMGRPGGGVNALRGHSNVQGITDICILAHLLPGYIAHSRKDHLDIERGLDATTSSHKWNAIGYMKWKIAGKPSDRSNSDVSDGDGGTVPNPWYQDNAMSGSGYFCLRQYGKWALFEKYWGMFVGVVFWDGSEWREARTWDECHRGVVISDLPMTPSGMGYPEVQFFRAINDGIIKVAFFSGENVAVSNANAGYVREALKKSFNVSVELMMTETCHYSDIVLPAVSIFERAGAITASPRILQWRDKVVPPYGNSKDELESLDLMFKLFRDYGALKTPLEHFVEDHAGDDINITVPGCEVSTSTWPEYKATYTITSVADARKKVDACWNYDTAKATSSYEFARQVYQEINQAMPLYKGIYNGPYTYLDGRGTHYHYGQTTRGPSWMHVPTDGVMARRRVTAPRAVGPTDPDSGRIRGLTPTGKSIDEEYSLAKNWGFSWPWNMRILYNREDPAENPNGTPYFFTTYEASNGAVDPWNDGLGIYEGGKAISYWTQGRTFWWAKYRNGFATFWNAGLASKFGGNGQRAVVDGNAVDVGKVLYGGLPEHQEPMESPVTDTAFHEKYPTAALRNPANEELLTRADGVGKASDYPYVLTTHRMGEHWHAGGQSRSVSWLMETQPSMYIEMSPELADDLGVKSGEFVRVTSGRTDEGIIVKANVTHRMRPLSINGKKTHVLAMPWHFAFKRYKYDGIPFNQGMRSPDDKISANVITIDAIDVSAHIPETKACLINVEKV